MASKHAISFSGVVIEATVTDNAAGIDEWVTQVVSANAGQRMIVGLDCECKPNTTSFENNITSTLQLCVGTKCLIIQLFYLNHIPQSLKNFLCDPNTTVVGVEIDNDVSKLRSEYCLVCGNTADIQAIATRKWPLRFLRKPGLKMLANKVVYGKAD